MKRAVHGSVLILASVLLLAACSGLPGTGGVDVAVGFTPTSLGFEVDDEGTPTVASHELVFSAAPGSSAAIATGFEVTYYDQAGEPLLETVEESTFTNRDAFAHAIPAGLTCVESDPCRMTSPDSSFERVASEPLANVVTLPEAIATQLRDGGGVAGYVDFTVFVTSDAGRDVEIPVRMPFTYTYAVGDDA